MERQTIIQGLEHDIETLKEAQLRDKALKKTAEENLARLMSSERENAALKAEIDKLNSSLNEKLAKIEFLNNQVKKLTLQNEETNSVVLKAFAV